MKVEIQEKLRKVSDHFSQPNAQIDRSLIELLFRERLFKCFLPDELNGLNLSLSETMEVIRECAYINGSLGWLIQIGNGGNYFASCFPESISKELFAPLSAVIAGSGAPSGSAQKTTNGFMLNGTWRYCSGADYAGLFTVSFICPQSRVQLAAVLTRDQIEVIPDWKTNGLSHTSTHSIRLDQVEVKNSLVFNVASQKSYLDNPVFRMPFVVYAQAFFLEVAIGLSSRFLNEANKVLEKKRLHWEQVFPKRLHSLTENLAILSDHNFHLLRRISDMTHSFQDPSELAYDENNCRDELTFLARKLREHIHVCYWDLGIEVVFKEHPIHQVYQDFIVCTQHYLLREN
jgi:indole-3-acetate monooxygenase